MSTYSQDNKPTIQLPVHSLNWAGIDTKKLRKIFFQFEVEEEAGGNKIFSLVAYPAYKKKLGEWRLGKKIKLEKKPGAMAVDLELPVTLGNLELRRKDIKAIKKSGKNQFTLTPTLWPDNPHATYSYSDGDSLSGTFDPSPPAPPANA